jgi:hypothetical protein
MPQSEFTPRRRSQLPLSLRISFILMLATVLPLGITVLISEVIARPALINQTRQAMLTDARTRTQLIDAYLNERVLDAATLSQVPTVQSWLAEPAAERAADLDGAGHAFYALEAGEFRDKSYLVWSLFDKTGALNLSDPTTVNKQQEAVVPPEFLQAMKTSQTGQPVISPVYYDPVTQKAFVSIYSPIYAGTSPKSPFLGFLRAKLNLDYIWGIVSDDRGANQSENAFILDQNGVLIADNDQNAKLFTAVAPLPASVQATINQENWYGQSGDVPIQANPKIAMIIKTNDTQDTSCTDNSCFNLTPNDENANYQAVRITTSILNWNYFVISPNSIVTQVADQQLLYTSIAALACLILALLIGWLVARRITQPILRSVEQLHQNSEALNTLAKKQQSASTEQLWVVDSIQVGLQSVQYYTDATRIAAHKLGEVGMELENHWHRQNIETIKQGLQQVISASGYIEKATHYQSDSGQKLATAIKVTTQVNEQLADSAISATESASQLEQVVNDLRNVIGQ